MLIFLCSLGIVVLIFGPIIISDCISAKKRKEKDRNRLLKTLEEDFQYYNLTSYEYETLKKFAEQGEGYKYALALNKIVKSKIINGLRMTKKRY